MIATVALAIAVLCLLGVAGVLFLLHSIRARQEHTLTAEVGARIGTHGLWVGAWLVGIAESRAEHVGEGAARGASPEEVLRVWDREGGRVISHVPGPEVISESEARGWLVQASEELSRTRVPAQAGFARERVFALLYASPSAPPVTARSLRDLNVFLLRPGILGSAFVVCPSATDRARGLWTFAAIAGGVLFVTGLVAAVIGIVAPASDPPGASTGTSPIPPAPTPPLSSTAVATSDPSPSASAAASGAPTAGSSAKAPLQSKPHK